MFETIKGWFNISKEPTAQELAIVAKNRQQTIIHTMIQEIVKLAHEQANAGYFWAAYKLPFFPNKEVENAVQHRLTILGYEVKEKVGNDSRRYLGVSWEAKK